jgi:hypothetical protein
MENKIIKFVFKINQIIIVFSFNFYTESLYLITKTFHKLTIINFRLFH